MGGPPATVPARPGPPPSSTALRYVRLRTAPARQLLSQPPAVTILGTEGIGYVGAVGDDQARWSSGFRRLLDALGGSLQVVLRFRKVDRGGVAAQRREVLVVVDSDAAAGLRAALTALGLTVAIRPPPGVAHTFGDELARSFRDRFGWHRTWYVDHFPGGELEPGWLLRLVPSGLDIDISLHAEPVGSGL